MEIINLIGFTISVISLCLTLYTLNQIRKLKKFYVFQIIAPQLASKMIKHDKNLSKLLKSFENLRPSIKKELVRLHRNLTSLDNIANKQIRASIHHVLLLIERYNETRHPSREALEDIQAELQGIFDEIDNAIDYERLVK